MAGVPPAPVIDAGSPRLIAWAKGVARGVRSDYKFVRGHDCEQELEGVALLEMVKAAGRFDPARVPPGGDPTEAFKGYAHASLKYACHDAAEKLLDGGTLSRYGRKQRKAVNAGPVRGEYLSRLTTPDGDPYHPPERTPDPRPRADPHPARVLPRDLRERPVKEISDPPQRFPSLETYAAQLQAELSAVEELRRAMHTVATLTKTYPRLLPAVREEFVDKRKAGSAA